MNIQGFRAGNLSYAVIDDFYTPDELATINSEILELQAHKQPPNQSGAAGNLLTGPHKKGDSVWLSHHPLSVMAPITSKIRNKEVVVALHTHDISYVHMHAASLGDVLLNYYSSEDYYGPHMDSSVLTAITMFKIGDFTGGDFWFVDQGIKVEFKENRVVIFPGCAAHKVDPIVAEPNNYRVTMAQFFNYRA